MTTFYVSKSGNDLNGGESLGDAFRNLAAAISASSDDDTILFDDGTFTGSEIENNATGYALLPNKSLTIGAVNPGSVTLNASVVTATFRWSSDLSGKTVTIQDLIFDVEGGAATNYHLWWRNTGSSKGALNVTNNTFADAAVSHINCSDATEEIDLTVTGNTATAAAGKTTRSFVNIANLNSGDIVINDNTSTILEQNNTQGTIFVNAVGSTCTFSAANNTISQTMAAGAGSFFFPVVDVCNIDKALVKDSTVNQTSSGGSASGCLVNLDCDSATLTANGCIIRNVNGTIDVDAGGLCLLIGHDATGGDGDNRCNNGVIEDCDVVGSAAYVTGGGHGLVQSNNTGGTIRRCKGNLFAPCFLQKGTTNATTHSCIALSSGSAYLQHKGCTNSHYYNCTVVLDGDNDGAGYVANVNTATNNSGCKVKNVLFYAKENTSSPFVTVNASQDVDLDHNGLYAVGTLPATVASFQGTNYSSIADYLAAQESKGIGDDPGFVNFPISYAIKESSRYAARGINWSSGQKDYLGIKYMNPPGIGAIDRKVGGIGRNRRLVLGDGFNPINTRTTYQEPKESPMRIRVGRKVRIGK